jgi:hypothetical protein
MLKNIAKKILPVSIRRILRHIVGQTNEQRTDQYLTRLRKKAWGKKSGAIMRCQQTSFSFDVSDYMVLPGLCPEAGQ